MEHTNYSEDMFNEPVLAAVADTENYEEPGIPGNVDFGYPRTLDELKLELHESLAERKDSSKWMSSEEFWSEMRRDLSWL